MNASLNLNDAAIRRQLEKTCSRHARHLLGMLDAMVGRRTAWRARVAEGRMYGSTEFPDRLEVLDLRVKAALHGMAARAGVLPLGECFPLDSQEEVHREHVLAALTSATRVLAYGRSATAEILCRLMEDAYCAFIYGKPRTDLADTAAVWAGVAFAPGWSPEEIRALDKKYGLNVDRGDGEQQAAAAPDNPLSNAA